MAEIVPGVTRHDCFWRYCLEGTKNALLQSGMAKWERFLDGREKTLYGKTIRTVYIEQDGIPVECNQPADATMIYARLSLDPVRASLNTATSAMLDAAGVKKPGKVVKLRKGAK